MLPKKYKKPRFGLMPVGSNNVAAMYTKTGVGKKRKRIRMRGGDFLGIGNFFTKKVPHFFTNTVPDAAKTVYKEALIPAHDFIKKHKLLSKAVGAVSGFIPHPAGAIAGHVAAAGLNKLGYGKKRKYKKMKGGDNGVASAGMGRKRRKLRGQGVKAQYLPSNAAYVPRMLGMGYMQHRSMASMQNLI